MKRFSETLFEDVRRDKNPYKDEIASHLKGFEAYSHGPSHRGFIDKGEKTVRVSDLDKVIRSHGYTPSSRFFGEKNFAGFHTWSYTKDVPYGEHRVSIDSAGGKHARVVELSTASFND